MKSPYGLDILDNCMTCPVREQHLFCNLSPPMVQRLNEITSSAIYPRGAMLFMEGQKGRGAFVLCTGKAKLSTTSRDGRDHYHQDFRAWRRSGTECDDLQPSL